MSVVISVYELIDHIKNDSEYHVDCVRFSLDSKYFTSKMIDGFMNYYENFNGLDKHFDYYIINDDAFLFKFNHYNNKFNFSDKFLNTGLIDDYISFGSKCKIMTKEEYVKLSDCNSENVKSLIQKFANSFIIINDKIDNLDNFEKIPYLIGFDVLGCENVDPSWGIDGKRFIIRNTIEL